MAAGALRVVVQLSAERAEGPRRRRAQRDGARSRTLRLRGAFTPARKAAGAGALEASRAHARAATKAHREPKARTPAPTPSSEAPMLTTPSPTCVTPSPTCVTLSPKRSPRWVTLPLIMPAHANATAANKETSRLGRMPVRCNAKVAPNKPTPCANGVCHQRTCRSRRRWSNALRSAIAHRRTPRAGRKLRIARTGAKAGAAQPPPPPSGRAAAPGCAMYSPRCLLALLKWAVALLYSHLVCCRRVCRRCGGAVVQSLVVTTARFAARHSQRVLRGRRVAAGVARARVRDVVAWLRKGLPAAGAHIEARTAGCGLYLRFVRRCACGSVPRRRWRSTPSERRSEGVVLHAHASGGPRRRG